MTTDAAPSDTTEALERFQSNVNELRAFLKLVDPETLRDVVKDASQSIDRELDDKRLLDVKFVRPLVSRVTDAVEQYLARHNFVYGWTAVILTTMVTTYLEENLELLAAKNSDLLDQAPKLENRYVMEAETIDDLRVELRRQWADEMLKGGPKNWFPMFKKLGASRITDQHEERLQHLWDTRNLIIHNRGLASVSYVRAYTHMKPLVPGERVPVNGNLVIWWIRELQPFVNAIDPFFLTYKRNVEKPA